MIAVTCNLWWYPNRARISHGWLWLVLTRLDYCNRLQRKETGRVVDHSSFIWLVLAIAKDYK